MIYIIGLLIIGNPTAGRQFPPKIEPEQADASKTDCIHPNAGAKDFQFSPDAHMKFFECYDVKFAYSWPRRDRRATQNIVHVFLAIFALRAPLGIAPHDNYSEEIRRFPLTYAHRITLKMVDVPRYEPYSEYRGKVALITGVGQVHPDSWGNGAATALLMSRLGAKIFGCDLTLEAATYTKKRIEADGGTIEVTSADVTKEESVKALVDACLQKYGRIDILINNVGRSEAGGPAEMSPEVWKDQLDVNLNSVYLCCHYVLPIMEKQGSGAVITIASIAAVRYIGKAQIGYSATKAAVKQFTSATAVIYAKRNPKIRLNCVIPGLMHTPLVKNLAGKYADGDYEAHVAMRDSQVPTGKMGTGFDVANASIFLCSDMASYITGEALVVDGAITLRT